MQVLSRLLIALPLLCLTLDASAAGGVLERLKVAKTLSIAYAPNSYPISFKGEDGEPGGYSVDLCRRIVDGIKSDLGLDKLEIDWMEGNTPRRLAAVANGEVDLECGTTTMNLQRQRQVDFSNIVFVESGGILVFGEAGIANLSGLVGKRVAVIPETTTEKRLRLLLDERSIKAELVPVKDSKDGRELMMAGKVDALAGDRLVLIGQVAATGEAERFSILDDEFSIDPYAFALKRNDADFRLAVNRGLARIYRTGEIDSIFTRWFGDDASPTELLESLFFVFGFND
jgi:glutamate/aspartate transport system substrate-binding protein